MNNYVDLPKNLKSCITNAFIKGMGKCYDGLEIISIEDNEVEIQFKDDTLDQSYDLQISDIGIILTDKLSKYFNKFTIDAFYSRSLLNEVDADDCTPCLQLTLKRSKYIKEY